jgi:hypothetical protein
LTLLRWRKGDTFKHSTLISFSDGEALPTAELFPAYHQRQDVEAGIKQGKGTFSFTKLRVRSSAGIRLLGQFALLFWPNFVPWAADWLSGQVLEENSHFKQTLQEVRTQVRIAANTSAVVLTNANRYVQLNHMITYSLNGMLIQVAVALIVYGLLVLYNQDATFSPARLLRQIQREFEEAIWLNGYLLGFWEAVRLLFPTLGLSS